MKTTRQRKRIQNRWRNTEVYSYVSVREQTKENSEKVRILRQILRHIKYVPMGKLKDIRQTDAQEKIRQS